jgi:hypothetical protein
MPLFREPKIPPAPTDRPETMPERFVRLSRQTPPPPSNKKLIAMGIVALVAVGGVIVTLARGTHPASEVIRRTHEEGERRAAREAEEAAKRAVLPQGPEAPLPTPAAPPAPAKPPAPAPVAAPEQGPDLAGLAAAVAMAKPEVRAAVRLSALQVYGAFVDTPKTRRTVFIDAARLAPDMAPEEEPYFAALTKSAVEKALGSADAATAAVLYLGSLRDRGGPEAAATLEALVLNDARPLELRIAAAHVLTDEARLRATRHLDAPRPGASPEEQELRRKAVHPALRAALR